MMPPKERRRDDERRERTGRHAKMQLRFAKMHGLGNDFMVVDLVAQSAELPPPSRIAAWSDRRTGIGFDQLLAVLPPDEPDKDFRCHIFNADGSEAEQCGNGARCVARFVVDAGLTTKRRLAWQVANGSFHTRVSGSGNAQVDMGVPSTEPAAVPFLAETEALSYPVDVPAGTVDVTPVGFGNPHAVIFVDDVATANVEAIGAALQSHERFPKQANVGFLQVVSRACARLRVYERGVGETSACGSGACAAMVAGRLHGQFDERAKFLLPGGELQVAWRGRGETARLSGDVQFVYQGRVRI